MRSGRVSAKKAIKQSRQSLRVNVLAGVLHGDFGEVR